MADPVPGSPTFSDLTTPAKIRIATKYYACPGRLPHPALIIKAPLPDTLAAWERLFEDLAQRYHKCLGEGAKQQAARKSKRRSRASAPTVETPTVEAPVAAEDPPAAEAAEGETPVTEAPEAETVAPRKRRGVGTTQPKPKPSIVPAYEHPYDAMRRHPARYWAYLRERVAGPFVPGSTATPDYFAPIFTAPFVYYRVPPPDMLATMQAKGGVIAAPDIDWE